MDTNANASMLSALLAEVPGGSFAALTYRKVGEQRGRGAARRVYGDDLVRMTIRTGFRYEALCRRSLEMLANVPDAEVLATPEAQAAGVSALVLATARAELAESLARSACGQNESTTDDVFDPLVVDGEVVRGARVYVCRTARGIAEPCRCRTCTGDERAPLAGTVYLQGLKIGEKVLEPAANGPIPAPDSAPKTIAKNLLRRRLPIAKYVSMRLEPGVGEWQIRAGGIELAAAEAA